MAVARSAVKQFEPADPTHGGSVIWKALDRYRDLGLLVARIGFGAGFVWFHGLPKLTGGPERWAGTGAAMSDFGLDFAPEFRGLAAALAETVGGLLLIAGLFFRPVCLALLAVMVVATTNDVVTGPRSARARARKRLADRRPRHRRAGPLQPPPPARAAARGAGRRGGVRPPVAGDGRPPGLALPRRATERA